MVTPVWSRMWSGRILESEWHAHLTGRQGATVTEERRVGQTPHTLVDTGAEAVGGGIKGIRGFWTGKPIQGIRFIYVSHSPQSPHNQSPEAHPGSAQEALHSYSIED